MKACVEACSRVLRIFGQWVIIGINEPSPKRIVVFFVRRIPQMGGLLITLFFCVRRRPFRYVPYVLSRR